MPEPNTLSGPPPDPDPKPDGASTVGWVPPLDPEPSASPALARTLTHPFGSTPALSLPDVQTRTEDTEPIAHETFDPARLPNIPGYRVEKLVGRGGMATVYRAVHLELNRVVALKLINPGGRDELYVRERFEREVQTLAAIEHPNVVRVYHAGDWHGFPFLTMKFVPGGALSQHIARFQGDHKAVARLVAKVARGVQALHAAGVLHRDLKPLNILLGEHDEPLVADFGLAKWVDDADSDLTVTHVPLGTRQYMSPEQTLGLKKQYAEPCDIWSIGVTLYELLAGTRPFVDNGTKDLYEQIRSAEPAPLPPTVPPALAAIALKCLAKKPEERYATATAVAEDLENWLAGRPLSVAAAPPVPPTPSWVVAVGVLALLALIFLPPALIPFGHATEPPVTPAPEIPDPSPPKPKPKPTIRERLLAGQTVVLIGKDGMPLEDYVVLRHLSFSGDPNLAREGYFTLDTVFNGAVELFKGQLPCPVRLEAEIALTSQPRDPPAESWVGVYVGRKETPSNKGPHHTLIAVTLRTKRVSIPTPTEVILQDTVRTTLYWWTRRPLIDGTHYPEVTAKSRMTSKEADGIRWQKIEVLIDPKAISTRWNDRDLELLPEAVVLKFLADNWPRLFPGANPAFASPMFGEGLGVCVSSAQGVFRNVRLVPVPRQP
jgi:serine/threonine protein kinase